MRCGGRAAARRPAPGPGCNQTMLNPYRIRVRTSWLDAAAERGAAASSRPWMAASGVATRPSARSAVHGTAGASVPPGAPDLDAADAHRDAQRVVAAVRVREADHLQHAVQQADEAAVPPARGHRSRVRSGYMSCASMAS